jgi:spermidine synthase
MSFKQLVENNIRSKPLVFKFRTKHAELSITQNASRLELHAHSNALHSVINLKAPQKLALKNLEFLAGILLFLPEPENILLLGTGGGSLVHFLRFHYPKARIIAVDLDAELLEIMHQKMQLPKASQYLTYVIDDAGHYLRYCTQRFDLILVDIFEGTQSPGWLLELQSMQRLYSILSNRGAVAYNLLIDSNHAFKQFYRGLRQAFNSQTLIMPVEGSDNTIAYALRYQPAERNMAWYMQQASILGESHEIDYMAVLSAIYDANSTGSGLI